MYEDLPPSLRAFETQLEQAVRQAGPAPRIRLRLVGATGVGMAGMATSLVLLLGTSATAPAYAVSSNSHGTVTVRFFRAVQGHAYLASLNARLAALGVPAEVLPLPAGPLVGCPGAVRTVTLRPALIPRKLLLAVDGQGRFGVVGVPAPIAATGKPRALALALGLARRAAKLGRPISAKALPPGAALRPGAAAPAAALPPGVVQPAAAAPQAAPAPLSGRALPPTVLVPAPRSAPGRVVAHLLNRVRALAAAQALVIRCAGPPPRHSG
jgi:hypothetical protein